MKTVVVTGGNRGIGLAASRQLAARGHRVILLCRDKSRGQEALDTLPPLRGRPERHRLVLADLASLESVREAARRILDMDVPVSALVNNAATLPKERAVSRDGVEMQLAVTHLAHFLLTNLLLPALRRAPAPSRVVTVSSAAHLGPAFNFSDPNFERRPYQRAQAYQQCKLANVLFTLALARRVAGTGVQALALHPGTYDTGLLRDYLGGFPGSGVVTRLAAGRADKAGPIMARLAVGRRDQDLNGAYFKKGSRSKPSSAARDREAQERLWSWSAEAASPLSV